MPNELWLGHTIWNDKIWIHYDLRCIPLVASLKTGNQRTMGYKRSSKIMVHTRIIPQLSHQNCTKNGTRTSGPNRHIMFTLYNIFHASTLGAQSNLSLSRYKHIESRKLKLDETGTIANSQKTPIIGIMKKIKIPKIAHVMINNKLISSKWS